MSEASHRAQSRLEWVSSSGGKPNLDQLQFGALQRIADATEKMAQRHTELIDERDRLQRYYQQEQAANTRLCRQLRAAKGVQTRLRKQAGRLIESEIAALRQAWTLRMALDFALDNGDCIATHEFLALWREGAWDELDAKFPVWKAHCEKLKHDPRAPL